MGNRDIQRGGMLYVNRRLRLFFHYILKGLCPSIQLADIALLGNRPQLIVSRDVETAHRVILREIIGLKMVGSLVITNEGLSR